jgi:excisionase family DNA binding protein
MAEPLNDLYSESLVVSPRRAAQMLDCGRTRLYELIANRELISFLDGRSRKITVDSIHQYIRRRVEEQERTNHARNLAPMAMPKSLGKQQ